MSQNTREDCGVGLIVQCVMQQQVWGCPCTLHCLGALCKALSINWHAAAGFLIFHSNIHSWLCRTPALVVACTAGEVGSIWHALCCHTVGIWFASKTVVICGTTSMHACALLPSHVFWLWRSNTLMLVSRTSSDDLAICLRTICMHSRIGSPLGC